jgi:hypothetical protein
VDFAKAQRLLPCCLRETLSHTQYDDNGCQFFHDYQREFLFMSAGVRVNIPGVLVFAPGFGNPCIVLIRKSYDHALFVSFQEQELDIQKPKLRTL